MYTYYRIVLNEDYPDQWFLHKYIIESSNVAQPRWFFALGKPAETKTLSVSIYKGTMQKLDWNMSSYDVPVVSYPVWELLSLMIQDDVQAIPCEVEGVEEKFILLNLLNKIECIDERKSKIRWPDEEQLAFDQKNSPNDIRRYRDVSNLTIDPARVGDHKLFWTKHWPAQIIRNDVRDAFLAAGFKGPSFIPV